MPMDLNFNVIPVGCQRGVSRVSIGFRWAFFGSPSGFP